MNGLTRCDEPAGVLIGPITLTGQLYYQGRPQGPGLIATTDEGLLEQARALKHALIAGHPLGMEIWRDDAAWELRWRE